MEVTQLIRLHFSCCYGNGLRKDIREHIDAMQLINWSSMLNTFNLPILYHENLSHLVHLVASCLVKKEKKKKEVPCIIAFERNMYISRVMFFGLLATSCGTDYELWYITTEMNEGKICEKY